MVKIYGIKNCDTMKKAIKWLDENNIAYDFHDYKKEGANTDVLQSAIDSHGWENVINRRGTTWRKLDEKTKANMNANMAIEKAIENPSIIKRPLISKGKTILLGFNDNEYQKTFK